ncbi:MULTISPECIES: N-acetylglucosamine kinase [Pedobacter]|uniref:N-acetylglucosamine kinase n=1 Tax=Pedobacter heparinus (strain ATCC 13125 / DSM 2366 / CIP 104194 / JCM 7457 / NBRC 12017 / NCIMB 9290 / NRRL B-14731 / HIM 762-3) TaxID=485917 RepID=C6XSM7_PEDHD|nr:MULTISPECIES: N-acetylglucosamine kinase [Pedobacter]ACU05590.1 N-acetylglucosamine kinase [Pedobacter heparinus DSM 2366]MBB5440318.1 N-acetylglucosamine kinase-like BadF-type ATPase [Pedobacter sp. AK017]
MILIADSGSTKTDWCLIDPEGEERYFMTEGYNPFFSEPASILNSIRNNLPAYLQHTDIKALHFYGAGCQDEQTAVIESILREAFPQCETIEAEMDLLAAARGLLNHNAGFAAILGTGTNTCIYDGKNITHNIDSLGFILGDEGSGAAIGKKILVDYLRDKMPQSVKRVFEAQYGLNAAAIINRIYTSPQANRFCAGFTRFLKSDEVDAAYSNNLLRTAFTEFFSQLVSCYPDYRQYQFNCIGSVAYHFQTQLREVLDDFKMKPGCILSSLIRELANYHK